MGCQYADQLTSDPELWFTFPAAFIYYRAGRYEDAEKLFSRAEAQAGAQSFFAKKGGYIVAVCEAFHAMNKAKLNGLRKAKELHSKAKAGLQKGPPSGRLAAADDDQWWDRLPAEVILAEAEGVVSAAAPPKRPDK